VADVVARQRETGIDLVNDGEFGHSMGIGVQLTIFGRWGINCWLRSGVAAPGEARSMAMKRWELGDGHLTTAAGTAATGEEELDDEAMRPCWFSG
jgi:hypothetical protein